MRKIIFFIGILLCGLASGQELSCKVNVNTQKVNQTSQQVFKTLATNLEDLLNKNRWTDVKVEQEEKIRCVVNITVNGYANNNIDADIQVQSYRPVYGTSYESNMLNYREKSISFGYIENEPIYFSENSYTGELSSLMGYLAYIIIGLDADSFSEKGGAEYFEKAMGVVEKAQVGQKDVWIQTGKNNRWSLATDLLSNEYEGFHKIIYKYHRQGLDVMTSDQKEGKEKMKEAIMGFKDMGNGRLNSALVQLFFDGKGEEIGNVFGNGEKVETGQMKDLLERLSPVNNENWKKIK